MSTHELDGEENGCLFIPTVR